MKLENKEVGPELLKLVELISENNTLQKKKIRLFLNRQSPYYFTFAENLSKIINQRYLQNKDERVEAAKSYNKMCNDFLSAQIQFRKSGKYPINDALIAQNNVYNDEKIMKYYMVGLLLSYMFWPNHYELFRFFLNNLSSQKPESYLEIGVGHGLFTSTMLSSYPGINATLIDISETSIGIAKKLMKAFEVDTHSLNFIHGDFLSTKIEKSKFDYIIMGEVLEHVNDGLKFMKKAKSLLSSTGVIYMSTAANSPALDHVLHFKNISEIHKLINDAELKIISELSLPSENVPKELWEKELITINYCAILTHM